MDNCLKLSCYLRVWGRKKHSEFYKKHWEPQCKRQISKIAILSERYFIFSHFRINYAINVLKYLFKISLRVLPPLTDILAIISVKSYRVYQHCQFNVKSQQVGVADAQSSHTFFKQELLSLPFFLFYQFEAPFFCFHGSAWFNSHDREAAAYGAVFWWGWLIFALSFS